MSDDETKAVAAAIHAKFGSLSDSFSSHCIFRVPEHIWKGNEKCYRPFRVSIGPIYNGDLSLKAMEEHKLRHLRLFLELNSNSYSIEHYIDLIREQEKRIRDCYEKDVSVIPSNEFTEMVLVDAAFLIYFVCTGNRIIPCEGYPCNEKLEPMYGEILRDLLLEENQLPFFILEDIFQDAFNSSIRFPSFRDIRFPSFRDIAVDFIITECTSLLRIASAESRIARIRVAESSKVEHLVDMMSILCLPSNLRTRGQCHDNKNLQFPQSISKLCAAGVKLQSNKAKSLLDITFTKGVLQMPTLVVEDFTEPLFRSIILFEQRHRYDKSYLIDYIIFLDCLIDTADDVRLLAEAEVLECGIGSDQAVANLFNGIADHLSYNANFYYGDVCKDLRAFASKRTNRWKAVLRNNYFNHPWSIISVIYAVVLLILTAVQTIASFTNK